jgi:hypothetical protein
LAPPNDDLFETNRKAMQPKRIAELKKTADEALQSGELTEDAQKSLIEVLTPDAYEQTWPDVEVVLHVAEHPVVAKRMQDERLPELLETALVEAFSAVLPLLGTRAFGPLANFAAHTRKRLDAERRKYELVAERLDGLDEDAAVRLLRNYISTDPAPYFVAKLRQRHSARVGEAERQSEEGVDLAVLVEDEGLVEALREPKTADADVVRQALAGLAGHPDVSTVTLQRAFRDGDADHKLVAAAIATFDVRADFAPSILAQVIAGHRDAAHMAVLAGRLAPLMARQVFSQFLAEAAWQNPEEPEAKITAERTHAILSARCVLPKIGSPLDAVDPQNLPDALDEGLDTVPDTVEAAWELWGRVK